VSLKQKYNKKNYARTRVISNKLKIQNYEDAIAKKIENKKVARIRRQRGYNWEDTLVKRFNRLDDWHAFRLGSPSTGLPDVLAVNSKLKSIFTIEAKSGTSTSLYVPFDQIERCQRWVKTFELYKHRKIILAFKFLSKKRIGKSKYERRELREFYKTWDESLVPTDLVCTYDNRTYLLKNGQRYKILLHEQKMPFK